MEFIILAAVLLIMAPLFALPFITAAHETMETDLRVRAQVTPLRTPLAMPSANDRPQAA